MHFVTRLVLLTPLLLCASAGKNVSLNWDVAWLPDQNPDGLAQRRVVGVNGQFPTPIVNVNSDDYLRIKVNNKFGDGTATTLHSHGFHFNNTNFYDGSAGVTQCPIPDGKSLVYETLNSPAKPADAPSQWGTYWSHGHFDGQYVDGSARRP